jgi:hypothetical protein
MKPNRTNRDNEDDLRKLSASIADRISNLKVKDDTLYRTVLLDRVRYKLEGAESYLNGSETLYIRHKPQETMDVGRNLAECVQKEAFFTMFYQAKDEWTESGSSTYMDECRRAAGRGVEITRVYIVETLSVATSEAFKKLAKPDFDSGIRTLISRVTKSRRVLQTISESGTTNCYASST